MSEWKEYKLGDICIGNGSYGIAAAAVPKDDTKYTYLRITDINDDGSLNSSDLKSVDDPNAYKYLLRPNDIVFARTGNSTGRTYFYDGSEGPLVYAGFLIKFSIDPGKVNPKILKYYTHSQDYFDWVKSFDSGATRGNINAKTYAEMPIFLPPRGAQDKIVSILSALDDKIETNRKINARLEELAQALFKSWFIDFAPFGGQMPSDWQICTLGDLTTECKEKVKNREDVKVLSPITSGELVLSDEYFSKQVYSKELSKYLVVHPNEFAYNPARVNIGSIGINNYDFDGCVSPVYVVLKAIDGYEEFINRFIKTNLFKEEVSLRAIGGVRQTLNYNDFSMIKFLKPSLDVVKQYSSKIMSLKERINTLNQESARLAELRDALLPKLMSGELAWHESL